VSSSPRVIAGLHRGRPLKTPPGLSTRPTSARVREALFGILGDIEGARVLDLYAGSGALALEALSRGAGYAVLVEHERRAVKAIRENVATLGEAARSRVVPLAVEKAPSALTDEDPFDLVLCDPPWDIVEEAVAAIARLTLGGKLSGSARVVVEHRAKEPPPIPECLSRVDSRAFGDTGLTFFRRSNDSAE